MAVATFDTHAAVKALTGAGFNAKQAETITDTVRDAVADGVATKADIKAAVASFMAEIIASERRLVLAMVALAGIIVALVKLLP